MIKKLRNRPYAPKWEQGEKIPYNYLLGAQECHKFIGGWGGRDADTTDMIQA
jgi:hypothetical protein